VAKGPELTASDSASFLKATGAQVASQAQPEIQLSESGNLT